MKKKLIYAALIFFSLLFLAPFFWMVTTSIKPPDEVFMFPPKWIPSWIDFSNYTKALDSQPFGLYFMNTMIIVVVSMIGQVMSSSLVAYGFARFKFKGRDALFMVILATMMIPWDVIAIPQYIEFNFLGWLNTLKPLIVPNFFGAPFFIFLLRQYILTLPGELEEAAKIDGANAFQIYWKVYMPLMAPALVLVAVFHLMNCWNDYLGPLIFLNDQSKYTLTLGLAQFRGMKEANMSAIMAVTSMICVPPLIAFFAAQKHIIQGISSTGIK